MSISATSISLTINGIPFRLQVASLLYKAGSNTILAIKFHPTESIVAVSSIDEVLTIINSDIKNISKYRTNSDEKSDVRIMLTS